MGDSEIEEGEIPGFFDSEMEEGEASGFWDSHLYTDIDVALSYLDDKIEELLGHHRKCFESELSLEKLGAKFGGYGSFLPAYERSPHTMTNNRTILKNECVQVPTRNNQPMQEAARKPIVSVKEACLSGPKHASSCAPSLPIPRQPSVNALAEAPNSSGKFSNTEPVNQFDQKTVKLRLTENAKNYSNLDLDMSPYPSAENRPGEGEVEGDLADSSEEYFDSPSDILRTMTSFPIPCGVMLSPLHENLVNLLKKKDALDRSRTSRVEGQERTVLLANEETPGDNKGKLGNRSLETVELKKGDSNDAPSKSNACLKKERDGKLWKGEHLSYAELKRPLESCKVTGEKKVSSSHKDAEVHKLTAKAASDGKVQHDKNVAQVPSDDWRKGDISVGFLKRNGDMLERVNECGSRTMHLSRHKSLPNLRDEIKTSPVEKPSFNDKRKSGSQSLSSSVSARPSKTLKIGSSVELKEGKLPSKSKGDSKRKVKLTHRDSTRDRKHGSDEYIMHLSRNSVDYKAKEYKLQASLKELAFGNISEEPASENKKMFLSETKPDVLVSDDATLSSVPIPINATPVLIKENWVGCDRCEKWRLLPYGTEAGQLPKKWRCDMLYWLPGMNKCSISEEETTNALNALYQLPVTGNQIGQQTNHVATETAVTSVVNQENLTFSSAGKQPGNKEVCNSSRFHHSTPRKRLSSVIEDWETPVERKIMCDRSQFPIGTKLEDTSGGMRPQKGKLGRKNDVDKRVRDKSDSSGKKLNFTEQKVSHIYQGNPKNDEDRKSDNIAREEKIQNDWKDEQQGMASVSISSEISGTYKLKISKDSTADSVRSSPSKILNRNNPGMSLSGKNGGGTHIGLSRPKGGDISNFSQKPMNENSFSNIPFTDHDDELTTRGHDNHDLAAASHQPGRNDGQNRLQLFRLRDYSSNQTVEDYSRQTTNCAPKQAKNLNHSADYLTTSGSGLESTEIFFQAALKLLQGASRHNPCNHMNANHREMSPAEMYDSAAKLSEYCASGFKRCNSMGFAALAYKCVEVAYMQVVNYNALTASRDWNELQVELQKVCAVESPSSSVSDLDNLNNDEIMGKFVIPKDAVELQATGDLVIPARNVPNLLRLLNFTQDVNFAMEAARKSQNAFAAAKIALVRTDNIDSISAIKRVLDLDFHNVEGLLQLLRNAMETLSKKN